jgi:membrane fusion protein (multidrug efflux system)
MARFLYLPALIALLVLSVPALAQKKSMPPVSVIVAPVIMQNFADRVEALGTTKANETVVITADTSEKIASINFEDGQEVVQGDLLATLDKSEEEAELNSAKAQLSEAESAYSRAQDLQSTSALSKAALQERLAALKQRQAAIEAIKAKIEKLTITAPFDGVLGLREVSVGTLVQPGETITTIDDLSQIKVDFDVPSVFLSALKPGLPITGTIEAFGDRVFTGEVRTINTQVDPVTRTVKIRAVLPNPDKILKPGLLMNITLLKNPRDALLIPEEALIKRSDKNFVYVVKSEENKTIASQKEIVIGARQPGIVEILSGLSAGEQVVTHGIVKISDGAEIMIGATETEDEPLDQLLNQSKEQ